MINIGRIALFAQDTRYLENACDSLAPFLNIEHTALYDSGTRPDLLQALLEQMVIGVIVVDPAIYEHNMADFQRQLLGDLRQQGFPTEGRLLVGGSSTETHILISHFVWMLHDHYCCCPPESYDLVVDRRNLMPCMLEPREQVKVLIIEDDGENLRHVRSILGHWPNIEITEIPVLSERMDLLPSDLNGQNFSIAVIGSERGRVGSNIPRLLSDQRFRGQILVSGGHFEGLTPKSGKYSYPVSDTLHRGPFAAELFIAYINAMLAELALL